MTTSQPPGTPRDPWERVRRWIEDFQSRAQSAMRARNEAGAQGPRTSHDGRDPWPQWVLDTNDRIESVARRSWSRARPALGGLPATIRRRGPNRRQAAIAAAVLLLLGAVLWQRCGLRGCPDVDRLASYQPGGASILFDRNGERFADLAPAEHAVVPLEELPAFVPLAFIAVEDRRFYDHNGVDWRRVFGAAIADIRAGSLAQGSSTIPMQLTRNLFPERVRAQEKSLRRKLLEVRLAREIEDKFEKDEILELYLNHIYFGGGAYGVEAASRYYFDKSARKLTLREAALLAAMPKAPTHYNPRRRPQAARDRRDVVLRLMAEQGHVTWDEAESARKRGLGTTREPERLNEGPQFAAYYVQHVRRLLENELGEKLYSAPLRILTTLDVAAQKAAEEALNAQLRRIERGAYGAYRGDRYDSESTGGGDPAYLQGAAVVMAPATGEVLAWVGGRDFDQSRFDRATNAKRQAGSAFKPFVYGAALEEGFAPSQPIMDTPYRLASAGRTWEPRNYTGRFEGRMSMREALVRSQNIPSIRLASAVGEGDVAEFARRTGIKGDIPSSPVLALGTTDVSPLEMATAYAAFASLGSRPEPQFVIRVEDQKGKILWQPEAKREQVIEPAVAFILAHMLGDVVDQGTGTGVRDAGYDGPAAGKTGTTNEATDAWFVGFTPDLVGAVWIGYDEVRPLPARATGGTAAAPVWGRMMADIYRKRPVQEWPVAPEGVLALWVDPESGQVLEEGCLPRGGPAYQELFLAEHEPATICPAGDYGSDFFGRIAGWLGGIFGGDEPARSDGSADPDLGAPRLPTGSGGEPRTSRPPAPAQPEREARESVKRREERAREERKRVEERARESSKRVEERSREAQKRAREEARKAVKDAEKLFREARKEAEKRGGN